MVLLWFTIIVIVCRLSVSLLKDSQLSISNIDISKYFHIKEYSLKALPFLLIFQLLLSQSADFLVPESLLIDIRGLG